MTFSVVPTGLDSMMVVLAQTLKPVHKTQQHLSPLGPEARFPFHFPETLLFPQPV
jgi:hypothetical protein